MTSPEEPTIVDEAWSPALLASPANFKSVRQQLAFALINQNPIHTGEWQAMDTRRSKLHATFELLDVSIYEHQVPEDIGVWQELTGASLPWAENHFQERVGGIPFNPPPSHVEWPHAVGGNGRHLTDEKFDHTYPERFWPKDAGLFVGNRPGGNAGIRFAYGDLEDVIRLIIKSPLTRQAYLPVWFPEDTGAVESQRVPCSIGYHFMVRDGRLHCWYTIRSCDIIRHMSNDFYLAGRLMQWIVARINHEILGELGGTYGKLSSEVTTYEPLALGFLKMQISSLHAFVGDKQKLEDMASGN